MRSRISIRGYVRPSVRPSVGPSVRHNRVEILKMGTFDIRIDYRNRWILMYALQYPWFIPMKGYIHPCSHFGLSARKDCSWLHNIWALNHELSYKGFPYSCQMSGLACCCPILPTLLLPTIAQDYERLCKITQVCARLSKIVQDYVRLHKIMQDCAILRKITQ